MKCPVNYLCNSTFELYITMLEDYSTDQSKSYKIQIECAQWFDSFAKLLKHSYELGYLILFFISPLLPPYPVLHLHDVL